jgi:hypothetical protein
LASIIDELLIQTLRAQLQHSRLCLPKIAEQLSAATTGDEKARFAAAYDEQLRQVKSMELQLVRLLRQQQQEPPDRSNGNAKKAV